MPHHVFDRWLQGLDPDFALPVFEAARKLKPSLPVFSYPFKVAPMASEEFSEIEEREALLPLALDYHDDDDDDDDYGPDDGGSPSGEALAISPEGQHLLHQVELLRTTRESDTAEPAYDRPLLPLKEQVH